MKRTLMQMFVIILCFSLMLPVSAAPYAPPYPAVDGGRAEQNMPVIFSVNTTDKITLVSEDFEDSVYNNIEAKNTLVIDNGAIKVEKTNTDSSVIISFKYTGTDIRENDHIAFACRIKTDGISGGAPRNYIEAYKGSTWLNQTHGYDGKKDVTGDNDWYDMVQMFQVPEGADIINLKAVLAKNMIGTVWFDDFKLYRLEVDPLTSVLISPNYKGLIYGDGIADINLDIAVEPQRGFYTLSDLSLSVKILDGADNVLRKATVEDVLERMNFVFSSEGLAEGEYYLQSILTHKTSGEVISKREHILRKKSADFRPDVYLSEDGKIIKNGKKTFLKRLYNYNGNYLNAAQGADSAGVSTLSNFGMWWYNGLAADARQYMEENNIQTHLCLDTYWYSNRGGNMGTTLIREPTDVLPFITRVVTDYKNDTVLDGYQTFGEPNPTYSGAEIRWNNEIIAQNDLNHPTYGVADKLYDDYGAYIDMADIIGTDPYPITGADEDDIAAVGRSISAMRESFPNRPVYSVLQAFDRYTQGMSSTPTRTPTFAEFKNMAWQAICEGAMGIDCFAYPDMMADKEANRRDWIKELKAILDEIALYEYVLLSDEPSPLYSVTGGGDWLNLLVKHYNGKTYIFAVNNTKESHSASVSIDGLESQNLSFESLGVVIREINQTAFASPEAELTAMGFSLGDNCFAVAEADGSRSLYVPADKPIINYSLRISDGARLYIGSVEISKNGKLTFWNADRFSVRVIAEDGTTCTEYDYNVVKY